MSFGRIILFFLLIINCIGLSQDPVYYSYTNTHNLPTTNFYAAIKLKSGVYWFGSDKGALRFNGYDFENAKTSEGVIEDEVFNLLEDSIQTLWLFTYSGDIYFKHKEDKIFTKLNVSENNGFISCSYLDDHTLYVGTSKGYFYQIINHKLAKSWKVQGHIIYLTKIKDRLMFYTHTRSYILTKQNKIKKLIHFHKNEGFIRGANFKDTLLFARNDSILIFKDQKQVSSVKLPEKSIVQAMIPFKGKIWICTNEGLYQLSKRTLSFKKKKFSGFSITNLLIEENGSFWITTIGDGPVFIENPNLILKVDNFPTTAIFETGDSIIYGSKNNNYYIEHKGKIEKRTINKGLRNDIHKVKKIDNEIFVIGKTATAILKNKTWYNLPIGFNDIEKLSPEDFLIGMNQSFILKYDGLKDFVRSDKQAFAHVTSHLKNKNNRKVIDIFPITNILKLNDTCIVGTNRGIYSYFNGVFKEIKYRERSLGFVNMVVKKDQTIYIGTSYQSLFTLDTKNINSITKISLEPNIEAIAFKNSKELWYASNNQVFQYDIHEKHSNLIFETPVKDGRINDIKWIKNVLHIGTNKGLYWYSSKTIINNKPLLNIKEKRVNNIYRDNLEGLSYKENNITIDLEAITPNSNNINYFFRVKGNDTNWNITSNPKLSFSSMKSGEHILEVFAENIKGVKSNKLIIPIVIGNPFWLKWWFIVILTIILGLVFYFIAKLRFKNLEQKHLIREQQLSSNKQKVELEFALSESENKALRMQMNPHFIFNALNSIKGLYAINNTVKANQYMVKFSKLLRNILENEEDKISINNEVEMLKAYLDLASIRTKNDFTYEIIVDPELDEDDTAIPTMLIQPFVENAIIHGISKIIDGWIKIEIIKQKDQIKLKIEDNGKGRVLLRKKDGHNSVSTTLTKKRLSLLAKKYKIDTGFEIVDKPNQEGTIVLIKIPLLYVD